MSRNPPGIFPKRKTGPGLQGVFPGGPRDPGIFTPIKKVPKKKRPKPKPKKSPKKK